MGKYDVVIIGGGPAGVSCAISARNTYPDKKILVIRKEKIALIPCGIPYTLTTLNTIDDDILSDKVLSNIGIDLIIDEVVNRNGKIVVLKSGKKISFNKLVLATGSSPISPSIRGTDKDGVFIVKKNYNYLKHLKNYFKKAEKIVIVGGGYIGVEMADEALKGSKNVTIIELLNHLLATSMDPEFGDKARNILESNGAKVLLENKVEALFGNKKVQGVKLGNGEEIPADMVIISVGSRPNVNLAEKFGIDFNPKHGIIVDEYLLTSNKDIFAIGDCAAKRDFFTGEFAGIMLASTAMSEGRLCGSNLFKIKVVRKYNGVLGSFSTKIGNTAFGVSGITEEKAKKLGIDYMIGESSTIDRHPGKLPDASKLYLKLIFSRYSHDLLGAQIHGGLSVGELVNMFSVMILNKMTDMEIDTLQIGTHPLLTASPIAYPVINSTVDAIKRWYRYKPEQYFIPEVKEINKKLIKPKGVNKRARTKILIIDDDNDFRHAIRTLLETKSYEVTEAVSGMEGLQKLKEINPNLIILDIMMETLDEGYTLNKIIKFKKEYEAYRNVPILMVSSIQEDPLSRFKLKPTEAAMVNPDFYMTKPVEVLKFLNIIEDLLKKYSSLSKSD